MGSRQPGHSGGGEPCSRCGILPAIVRSAAARHRFRAGGNSIPEVIPSGKLLSIEDRDTIRLATLQVKVEVRSAQMADPELTSVLALFRRAANVIARLEDAAVFRGLDPAGSPPAEGVAGLPKIWQIHGGKETPGLWAPGPLPAASPPFASPPFASPPFSESDDWQWIPVATPDLPQAAW